MVSPGSGQVEVERVQEVDRRVEGVDSDVGGDVKERLRVVEDDLHPGVDEVGRNLLRAQRRDREHADDDVLLPHDVAETSVIGDGEVADGPPDLLRIAVEDGRDVDSVLTEDRRARNRLAETPGADERDV